MQSLRVVLVGAGEMGRLHLQTLAARSGVEVVAVVRESGAPLQEGIAVFRSLSDALNETDPNFAIISTPHHLHVAQARTCLDHGCHVLVEKPIALQLSDAEELIHLADAKGCILVEGLQRRYEGLCQIFRELHESGDLGDVLLVHGFFAHRFSSLLAGWRSRPDCAGLGIIDDSAIHLLDLVTYFAGGTVRDVASRVTVDPGLHVPSSFACTVVMDNDVLIAACGSYLSPANSVQEEISILGTKGSLFGRRFRENWDTTPPRVVYKSADGSDLREFNLSQWPCGRSLPLLALLDVLQNRAAEDTLHSVANRTLQAHRVLEDLRRSSGHN